jgi:hypothetical protein
MEQAGVQVRGTDEFGWLQVGAAKTDHMRTVIDVKAFQRSIRWPQE